MPKFNYVLEAFLPDGRRIVSWTYPVAEELKPKTLTLFTRSAINIIKTRKPEFKDQDITIKVSLDGKEIKNAGTDLP